MKISKDLLPCCIKALYDKAPREPEEGDIIVCPYCNDRMICRGGIWEWYPRIEE